MFHVISGSLKLEIWRNKIDHDDTVVVAGESCEIPPLVYHRFKALTDVVAYELYEARLRGEDIKRETVGGLGD